MKIAIFLLISVFLDHIIRCFAFNRYEALTFEYSLVSAILVTFKVLLNENRTGNQIVISVIFVVLFVLQGVVQDHFRKKLSRKIKKKLTEISNGIHGSKEIENVKRNCIENDLYVLCDAAIVPQFSRFIEESKFMEKIGLITWIKQKTKREKFQKNKYLSRKKMTSLINSIGVDTIIMEEDFALNYKDEKMGLLLYDVIGFGSLISAWIVLYFGVV